MNNTPMILLLIFIVLIYPTLSKYLPVDPAVAFGSVDEDESVPGLSQYFVGDCDATTPCPCLLINCIFDIKEPCINGHCFP
uniref:Nodule Cysteine-Rich (NCR) secreted peptide n=1 Tax=Globodera rostochiensis TaxID=31243 RepID=A0A914HY10_GLORO